MRHRFGHTTVLWWAGAILVSTLGAPGCAADRDASVDTEHDEVVARGPSARRKLSYTCPRGEAPIKVAFFDADSTLRVSKANSVTAVSVDDVAILPFVAKAIRAANDDGFLVAIVSNQGGVAAGRTTLRVAEGALVTTAKKLGALGARVNYLDFAEAHDGFRKPEVGMATKLDEIVQAKCRRPIDFSLSTMTGDSGYKKDVDGPHPDGRPADDFSNADRLFAENLGVPFSEPTDAFGWREFGVYNLLGERELTPFLVTISEKAAELRASGDEARADELDAEVEANRRINGLE